MMEELFALLLPFGFVGLGYIVGTFVERRHLALLDRRETASRDILVTNLKHIHDPGTVERAALVDGQVVIATDYFKTIATFLKKLVGGEMRAAQTLLLRARREALQRMVDDAQRLGATEVWNVRYEYCNVSQMTGNKGAMSVEIYAYGTAVIRRGARRALN